MIVYSTGMRPGALVLLRYLLLLLAALPAFGLESATRQRLAWAAHIWGEVKYMHPYLGYRDIDWDTAGVRAIEKTLQARSDTEAFAALDEMLSVLHDPLTRVYSPCLEPPDIPPAPAWRMVSQDAIFIPAAAPVDEAMKTALRAARVAIIDLRAAPGRCYGWNLSSELVPLLFSGTVALPNHRVVRHHGYRTQEPGENYTPYDSSFVVEKLGTASGTATTLERVVFVVNDRSSVHAIVGPLVHSGRAIVIAAGSAPPAGAQHTLGFWSAEKPFLSRVRVSELVDDELRPYEPVAQVTLPADASEEAIIAAALDPRGRKRRAVGAARRPLPDYTWRPDATYASMSLPPIEYRVLAAFRIWNVIRYFYAYKDLIDPWDPQLGSILEQLAEADTQQEYELAIAKVMTLVPDGHTFVYSNAFLDLRGRAPAPFQLMPVEGKPVVVEIYDASATAAGVKTGDELVSIDGRLAAERIAELRPYVAASTDAAKEYYLTSLVPFGPSGSTALFSFRRPDGATYEATLSRGSYGPVTPSKPWRILTGTRIAYVELRSLEPSQVAAMFAEIAGTDGLILDIRGYPRGVFPELAWRMNTTGKTVISQIRIPEVKGGVMTESSFGQNLGSRGYTPYRGKTVALIDERAQSQSEHTCLTLEAVAGTKFVGSNTVGANGNVTYFVLPGNNYVRFTGMDVRHADYRQLQRIGIVPDLPVPRTVAALGAGRDEVLEAAVALLQQ